MELSVDAKAQMKSGDQSSSSAPKPKREHKKSKSTDVEKIGEINSLSDGVNAPSAEKLDIVKKTSQEVTKEVEVWATDCWKIYLKLGFVDSGTERLYISPYKANYFHYLPFALLFM